MPSKFKNKCEVVGCENSSSAWGIYGYVCESHTSRGFYQHDHMEMYPPELRFLYFIYSNSLQALKIGVGQYGRLRQIQLSGRIDPVSKKFIPSGWKLLKLAGFGRQEGALENDNRRLLEAEQRVLKFWLSSSNQGPYLSNEQMGIDKSSNSPIGGASETVKLGSVCEIQTWFEVTSTQGYLGEVLLFRGFDVTPRMSRKLRCIDKSYKCKCN